MGATADPPFPQARKLFFSLMLISKPLNTKAPLRLHPGRPFTNLWSPMELLKRLSFSLTRTPLRRPLQSTSRTFPRLLVLLATYATSSRKRTLVLLTENGQPRLRVTTRLSSSSLPTNVGPGLPTHHIYRCVLQF